jgi:DNA-binding GntR family transcriptional regulator
MRQDKVKRRTKVEPQAPAGNGALRRRTVVEMTAEALRERILRGDYPEGTPLRQDALATELGVSRIPVREALRQLEVEGLVTFSPHVGAIVSTLSLDEIGELFELRAVLESELLKRAMPNLTNEVLERAESVLDAYDAALERGDVAAWGELIWEFHSTLLAAAQRPLTLNVLSMLHNQSDRYTRLQLALTHGEDRARYEHHGIMDAARAGDAKLAVQNLRSHIQMAGRSLIQFLREHRRSSAEAERS